MVKKNASNKQKDESINESIDVKDDNNINKESSILGVSINIIEHLLFAFTIAIYYNSLKGAFVYDDLVAVKDNKDIDSSKSSIIDVLRDNYWGDIMGSPMSRHQSYRPVSIITFRITHSLFGMNPYFFHLGNILLNGYVSVVLYRCLRVLLRGLDGSSIISLGAILLFATHPIHTEAVSGIVGRADLLAAIFGGYAFLSFASAFQADEKRPVHFSTKALLKSIGWTTVAILSKETGAMIVPCCTAYDMLIICGMSYQDIFDILLGLVRPKKSVKGAPSKQPWVAAFLRRQMIFLSLFIAVLFFRFGMNQSDVVVTDWQTNPSVHIKEFVSRALTKSYYSVLHAWLLVYPAILSCDWACLSIPIIENLSDERVWSIVALFGGFVTLVLALLFKPRKSDEELHVRNFLLISLVFVLVPFLPSCGLFLDVGFTVAERILFMPSYGYAMFVAFLLFKLCSIIGGKGTGRVVLFTAVIVLVSSAYTARTILRNEDWESEKALFKSAAEVFPANCKMLHNYATTLNNTENFSEVENLYREAIRIHPAYGSAYTNLGVALAVNGRTEQAIAIWEEGLAKSENLVSNNRKSDFINLGLGNRNLGRLDVAEKWLKKALEVAPNDQNAKQYLEQVREMRRGQSG